MYPRNAASPERIAVGAVVQISDGAVQTSGVSIAVRGQGGASGAGSGTTAYDNGIVEYTPTQGETDFTSFIVIAYKSGCIPVSQTIVTTTHVAQTGDTYALAAGATGFTAIDTVVDAILVDTAEIGAAGAGLTALASASLLTTVAGYLDTEIAAILADTNELQTDWADGGRLDLILDARASQTSVNDVPTVAEFEARTIVAANYATAAALATVDNEVGVIDGIVDDIKAKTDSLNFTQAGHVDANIQRINDVALTGDGSGTPFDVA